MDELRGFCVEAEDLCFNLQVPEDIDTVFRELPNGDLEISYSRPEKERKYAARDSSSKMLVVAKPTESVAEIVLAGLATAYHVINGRWPESLEELRESYAEMGREYGYLDVPDRLEVVFCELANGDLEITYSVAQDGFSDDGLEVMMLEKPSLGTELQPCGEWE